MKRVRDLTLWPVGLDRYLVIAADVAAGIGPMDHDLVRADAYIVGRFTARVPLVELIAAGARPFALVNTQGVAPQPYGQEILRGIWDEAAGVGLQPEDITGSWERNIRSARPA